MRQRTLLMETEDTAGETDNNVSKTVNTAGVTTELVSTLTLSVNQLTLNESVSNLVASSACTSTGSRPLEGQLTWC